MTNPLRRIWAAGRVSLDGWLAIPSPYVAELMAAAGHDSLTLDLQHGLIDYAAAVPMLQALRGSSVVPLARVPWLEPGIIMKMLDAGAMGIICPMVDTPAMAAEFVACCRYPPEGRRSYGPTRAALVHGADYHERANRDVLTLAMVETAEGMKNIEAIAATPGLDGIYVGPSDLTLGTTGGRLPPGLDREEAEMIERLRRIAAVCRAAGIAAGIHCGSVDYALKAAGWGYHLTTVQADNRLLAEAAAAGVAAFREAAGARNGG